jgi:glutathione S-transferase
MPVPETTQTRPLLYSFRRCPYAIRARMALFYADVKVQLQEVSLRDKPANMLAVSAKGTVPVLVLPGGQVLDESLAIMHWALDHADPGQWRQPGLADDTEALVASNDGRFKHWLDRYKYADRYPEQAPEHYRAECERYLQALEKRLQAHRFLQHDAPALADVALFPFIRQFCFVDQAWFKQAPYKALQRWLDYFLQSTTFKEVIHKNQSWTL